MVLISPEERGRPAGSGTAHSAGLVLWLLISGSFSGAVAQQVPDSAFRAEIRSPAYPTGEGPVVAIDGAHHNFHTADGGFLAFANLLRQDGFQVSSSGESLEPSALEGVDILVIANALARDDLDGWVLPNPSAFTPSEIASVKRWVEEGGALLLIADHMPFPGAAGELAEAFEVSFLNGFAMIPGRQGPIVFRKSDGTLTQHWLTDGLDSVATFTGSAFEAPGDATILLGFPEGTVSLQPDTAWVFQPHTPRVDVAGWAQGLVRRVGQGRVAVFGEAAMFSAQLAGPQRAPMGMNAPVAAGNARLVINLVRWLAEGSYPTGSPHLALPNSRAPMADSVVASPFVSALPALFRDEPSRGLSSVDG